MSKTYLGEQIPKLGFGLMRLPSLGTSDKIDIEQTKKMVDRFMASGFTYFDTAYVYNGGKSETAARLALVERYPRASFQLATKLPLWGARSYKDLQTMFDTSLERTGAGYFDYYLLHALDEGRLDAAEEIGAWKFLQVLKEKGLIKHAGFSFHDTADVLEKILTSHPEAEFVQLQINYADWESEKVQSKLCYEVARKHNKPIIVMEPVKGGSLGAMSPAIQQVFRSNNPYASVASWAIRFAASLDGIITVLSGMSNMEQLTDNISYMADFKPLDEDERAVVAKVVDILNHTSAIRCTNCKYCVADCPQKINIPQIFGLYNQYLTRKNLGWARMEYAINTKNGGKASACIRCGSCEGHCPQHISIMKTLKKIAAVFE